MRTRPTPVWSPEGPLDTPYKKAQQEWDSRMGSALVHARNWRLAAFASLGLVALAMAGLVYLGAKPKAVPHIIEVDRLGEPRYRGPAGAAAYVPSEAVLKFHLRRFIESTRSISSDAAVLRQRWLEAYALVTPRGANMLSAYVAQPGNDPFKRAQEERVTAEVLSMLRVSADTWQIDWRESRWDKRGYPLGEAVTWRAMVKVVLETPKTDEALVQNPLGLFIDEIHWDRIST
jgi:type IV secretion system protein VirB5